MKEVKYNELTVELAKKLKVDAKSMPERGDVIEFKILQEPIEIQDIKGNKSWKYPACKHLKNVDIVYSGGEKYHIAYITGTDGDGGPLLGRIEFLGLEESTITIDGRNPKDFDLLKYLRCSNANKSNPLATGRSFLFEELQPVKGAKASLDSRKAKANVEASIYKLSNAEAITFLKALKQPVLGSEEENVLSLITFVQNSANLKRYMGLSSDVRTPIMGMINDAVKLEIISYEDNTREWKLTSTGKTMMTVVPGADEVEQLVDFMHNDTQGSALKEYIENEVTGKALDKKRVASREEVE